MADTRRDLSDLQALLADNTTNDILPQGIRDALVSAQLENSTWVPNDLTLTLDHRILHIHSGTNAVTLTLPSVTGILGRKYVFKIHTLTNPITIVPSGGANIEGVASYSFNNTKDSLTLFCDGTNWQIVSEYMPGVMPIGSILAWTNHITGTPALPIGWQRCDGSVIADAASPMNGQNVPDLNGEYRFLRGSSTSGTEQADAMQGHHHSCTGKSETDGTNTYGHQTGGVHIFEGYAADTVTAPITDGANGTPRTAYETRPRNMFVIWIMRIK